MAAPEAGLNGPLPARFPFDILKRMVIREEQTQEFSGRAESGFGERLARDVERAFPDQTKGFAPAVVESTVRGCIARARSHGFETESALARFTYLMFEAGPTFDTDPVVAAILSDTRISPGRRLSRLSTHVPPAVWRRIIDRYDVRQWAGVAA